MSNKEIPLQINFDGRPVDNRTRRQKREDRQAAGLQQAEMFSQREVAQFGVNSRPQLPGHTRDGRPLRMQLEMEDPRSEEERAQDEQRAAEQRMKRMFEQQEESDNKEVKQQ